MSALGRRGPQPRDGLQRARPPGDHSISAPPVTTMTRPSRSGKPATSGSEAAAPETAVTPQHVRQILLVAGPALVLRQLQVLLDPVPALAGLGLGLHRSRSVLQERQLILHV